MRQTAITLVLSLCVAIRVATALPESPLAQEEHEVEAEKLNIKDGDHLHRERR